MAVVNSLFFRHSRTACTAASVVGKLAWGGGLWWDTRSPDTAAAATLRLLFSSFTSRDMFCSCRATQRLRPGAQRWRLTTVGEGAL